MSASAFPSGEATSFIGQHLRGPRAPVLAAVEELGYTCGPEEPNPPDLPRIRCAGPDGDSTVIIIAAEDDFRGIGLTTHEMARMDEFFAALGSDAISDDLIDSFEGLIELAAAPDSLCPIPCESVETGKNLGNIEARLGVYEGLLLVGVLQEIDF